MSDYTGIYIIYNPNSTGDSKAMAQELQHVLRGQAVKAQLMATKYAGHAREIAKQLAGAETEPLIVSSSGDGGYNEVVNGVMESGNPKAICAVLPAGNANDHSRTVQRKPLSEQIVARHIKRLDLIKVEITNNGSTTTRYAHSYVGLGLTPVVAAELNKHSLNAFRELRIVVRTFFKYRPFKIRHDNHTAKLDSLLFANINQMAKVLTLAPENRPRDGKFEIVQIPAGHKWQLVKRLAKAAVTHLDTKRRANRYECTVLKKMPIQLDGEVMVVHTGSIMTITSVPKALRTVI